MGGIVTTEHGPTRILVVEAKAADATLVMRELQRADPASACVCVDSLPALQDALTKDRWDAVISAWTLPGFDALAVMALVRATGVDLPFIVVSGTGGEELAVAAMRAGAHDYVAKANLARLPVVVERELREARMRQDHRRQAHRFQALIERSAAVVLLSDRAGNLVYTSPAAMTLYGWRPEELVGRNLLELVHPDDRARIVGEQSRVREITAAPREIECRIVRRDGATRWVSVTTTNMLDDPAVAAIVTNVRDVTDDRRATDALQLSEARFARLAESGIIGTLTADSTGRIHTANEAYAAMVGYSVAELTDAAFNWLTLIPPDHAERTAAAMRTLAAHGTVSPYETAAIHKHGEHVPMLVGFTMLDAQHSIAFCVDLSERSRSQQALHDTTEQLRHAQKMEAVGRLAGGVAHDFNNVLSVIMGYAGMLIDDLAIVDPRREDATEIHNACERAANLTRQLLMFSRQQVLAPKVLDLDETFANMRKMLHRLLGEDVDLVIVRGGKLGRVLADQSSIEQVVMNLVVNARDAMPTGGKLTIETADVLLDAAFVQRHIGVQPGPHVLITVRDTGGGMDAQTMAHIFEPFFTTKPKEKGTGLGLSIVFGIVQQSGGTVWVDSEVGVGTTFKIYLPHVHGEVEASAGDARPVEGGDETILLVEDDDQLRVVARNILTRQGYKVLEAATPNDAIARGASFVGSIDLLLTDVIMPQMGGPALARSLGETRPGMKVLFMSGYTDDSVVRHGVLTTVAFLQKPLTPSSLAGKVRDVLDGRT
ncbi:MAG: PAS domain S-box protein [Proteobacteria bacterium]|nr:PAS domain S-box protein [Pseudomonadota bacterium]